MGTRKIGGLEILIGAITAVVIVNGIANILTSLGLPSWGFPFGFNLGDYALSPFIFGGLLLAAATVRYLIRNEKLPITMGWFGFFSTLGGLIGSFLIGITNLMEGSCNIHGIDNTTAIYNSAQNCYIPGHFISYTIPLALIGTGMWVAILMILYMVISDWHAAQKNAPIPYGWFGIIQRCRSQCRPGWHTCTSKEGHDGPHVFPETCKE